MNHSNKSAYQERTKRDRKGGAGQKLEKSFSLARAPNSFICTCSSKNSFFQSKPDTYQTARLRRALERNMIANGVPKHLATPMAGRVDWIALIRDLPFWTRLRVAFWWR